MKFKILLIIGCLVLSISGAAQDNFTHNYNYNYVNMEGIIPTVAEYQALKHYNTDFFDGKLSIDIPIYTINTPNEDFSLPISLSYSTSGIKVSSTASKVGANWHLNGGG